MKKLGNTIGVLVFLLFGIICIGHFFFKMGIDFVSGIDGNRTSSNYIHIIDNYYLLKTEKTICVNFQRKYKRITFPIDSLSWNSEIIIGHSRMNYFKINIANQKINYFGSKDSLLKSTGVVASKNLSEVPQIK